MAVVVLSDDGSASYHRDLAVELVELGAPAFACTPQAFPGPLSAVLAGDDPQGMGGSGTVDAPHP